MNDSTQPPAGHNQASTPQAGTGETDIVSKLETVVKLVAGGAAISAMIGLPAVYLHYLQMDIPTSFITYEQILRAGIAPAVLSLFLGIYVVLSVGEYNKGYTGLGVFMVPGFLFSVIPIAAFVGISIGLLAGASWLWWWLLKPLFMLVELTGFEIGDLTHLYIATAIALLNLGVPVVWPTIVRITQKWWIPQFEQHAGIAYRIYSLFDPLADPDAFLERFLETGSGRTNQPAKQPASTAPEEQDMGAWSPTLIALGVIAGLTGYLYGALYAIRWYLGHFGVAWLPNHSDVAIVVAVVAIGSVAFYILLATWRFMRSEQRWKRLLTVSLNVTLAAALFGSAVWFYSIDLYQKIPQALGGGKLDTVSVWISREDVPFDIGRVLAQAKCTVLDAVVVCDELSIVHRDDDDVILAGASGSGRGVLVPRAAIKAVTWK